MPSQPSPLLPLQQISSQLRQRVGAIVIGASAGGIEALGVLLPALPARLLAAVIVVLHLPRDRPSLLVEIFAHKCACPVREAIDKEPIENGTVYFAPPDYHLLLDLAPAANPGGAASRLLPHLSLSIDELVNYSRPSIDVLFESAADTYKDRLLGIVLTGANDDGSAGLAKIHQRGGVAMVQDPAHAQNAYMPESALRKTPAALVLTLDQIATVLRALEIDSRADTPHARQ